MSGFIVINNVEFIQIDNHEETNKKAVKDLKHQIANILPLSAPSKRFRYVKEIETLALFRLLLIKLLLLQLRKKMGGSGISRTGRRFHLPQHFFYFFPLPQGEGSFLPILDPFSSPLYVSGFNTLTILSDIGIICGNIFLPLKEGLNSSIRESKSLLRSNSGLFNIPPIINSVFWGYLKKILLRIRGEIVSSFK